jgi:MerR family transcriptional regulator/heat shock protein HspR
MWWVERWGEVCVSPQDLYRWIHISYSPKIRQNQVPSRDGTEVDVPERDEGVFAISVAAEMASMQIQNLRVYERRGLVAPDRTAGGTRLYSEDDVDRLRRIGDLLAAGLNLAGIAAVLALEADNARLRAQVARLKRRG